MGGYGSGGGGYALKNSVEDGLRLDLNLIVKTRGIRPHSSVLRWYINEESIGSIGYDISFRDGLPVLKLEYRWQDTESVTERICLVSTPQPYGNERYWMLCPILVHGSPCNRRCYKFYKPPGQKYFGCRTCMNLTYQSCKDSHKMDGYYARIASDLHMPLWRVKALMKM